MQYEVMIDVLLKVLMLFGAVFVTFLSYALYCELEEKVKQVMNRQSKIRCLCKHEYEQKFAWRIGVTDYKEVTFKCRKCGKILKANIVVGKVGCNNGEM